VVTVFVASEKEVVMAAPFRVRRSAQAEGGLEGASAPPSALKDWMDRVMRLIPSEVLAVYLAGKGNMPENWLGGWSFVCLALVLFVRAWGTHEPGKSVQWIAVIVSAVSFVVWVFATNGRFLGIPMIPPGAASALVLVWAVVVPIIYKGD
jgi:hypothetical protein